MSTRASLFSAALLLTTFACVRPSVEAPVVAVVAPVAAPAAAVPTGAYLPAGPGVTLVVDQLEAVVRDRRVTAPAMRWQERVSMAEAILGVAGEPFDDPRGGGVAFRAVTNRSLVGPFGCHELVFARASSLWSLRNADHRLCGLPYAGDSSVPYWGASPKRTSWKLQQTLAEIAPFATGDVRQLDIARTNLGMPDLTEDGEWIWIGLGARTSEAPISCKLLFVGRSARIEDGPLSRCSLAWPMPGMSFDPGPTVPPLSIEAKLAECRCGASEVCMIDRRLPATASLRTERDGERARFSDGRAAKLELATSCVAIPAGCSQVGAPCFFPAPGTSGPCPRATFRGQSFGHVPIDHIVCHSVVGAHPARSP